MTNCADNSTFVCSCSHQLSITNTVPIESLKLALKLNKKMLSSYHRRLTCAQDDRTSSKGLGVAGVCVIVTACFLIIVADVPHFINAVRLLRGGYMT